MNNVPMITSRQNEHVCSVCELKKNPTADAFLLEGQRFVCDTDPDDILEVFTTTASFYGSFIKKILELGKPVYEVSAAVMDKLCQGSQGICAVVKAKEQPLPEKLVVLDTVQDPGNVGTILRTALAFGYGCLLNEGCANPYSSKVIQSSAGAILSCPIRRVDLTDVIPKLRRAGMTFLSAELDETASTPDKFVGLGKFAIIIGNEGNGVSPEVSALADKKVYIPIRNTNSLNAAIAAGILMDRLR